MLKRRFFVVLVLFYLQYELINCANVLDNVPELLQRMHNHAMFLNNITKAFGKLGKKSDEKGWMSKSSTKALLDTEKLVALVNCDRNFNYRSITGYCNNLIKPELGSAYSTFLRLQPNVYDDGINAPRKLSISGRELPSPRVVSNNVHSINPRRLDALRSDMYMLWGQYLDHDILATALTQPSPAMKICNDCKERNDSNSNCFPIPIPDGDSVFSNGTCMAFGRSINGQIRVGPREQLNVATSFIDASTVYGSEVKRSLELRELRGGRLKTVNQLMPPASDGGCLSTHGHHCFAAGDARNTVIQPLASLHTLWVWEHNRIASNLQKLNPHWNDETLFLETRRIIGALHQRITYNEYLPITLSENIMRKYYIVEEKDGHFFKYYNPNINCDPTIFTEFATAAFRFGHSMINPAMTIDFGIKNSTHHLKGNFLNPDILYENPHHIRGMLCGATVKSSQLSDSFLHDVMRNNLFSNRKNRPGLDLASINIQRGRDHGIAGYTSYRKRFGLSVPQNFSSLESIMDAVTVKALLRTYDDVQDIDLFTGILAERSDSADGSVVGPLGARMIAEQFKRLKHCDRFWYSNTKLRKGFTANQLREIRKIKLADIICEHLPRTMKLRENALKMTGTAKMCKNFKKMNFTHWMDTTNTKDAKPRFQLLLLSPPRINPEGPNSTDFGLEFRTYH